MGRVAEYGRGHPKFLAYAKRMVEHPAYHGMPDLHLEDGEIQWEAPSNRPKGKFQLSHQRRLDWWKQTARRIGIDPDSKNKWISATAKAIHPYKIKPCKNCGLELDIRYVYPSNILRARLNQLDYFRESSMQVGPLDDIRELVPLLHARWGDRFLDDLPDLLRAKGIAIPGELSSVGEWLSWINDKYITAEPATLSPGAMSNAPDRLDGFHSFNRCCRHKADRGRSKSNLQSYTTDRRAFEYWVDGDWITADRLMGLIRSNSALQVEDCLNSHAGPCDADHIGPISLGFSHRPEFQLLCSPCNSAKNNRLTISDVKLLRAAEERGDCVTSWYCEALWKAGASVVADRETALRLSKMLRDNRHTALTVLGELTGRNHLVFLCSMLGLEFAERTLTSTEMQIQNHVVRFKSLKYEPRTGLYVVEQKARRIRVAFEALESYLSKEDRNARVLRDTEANRLVTQALLELEKNSSKETKEMNEELASALRDTNESSLRELSERIPTGSNQPALFEATKKLLRQAMDQVAKELIEKWTDVRYTRAEAADKDE